MELFNTDNLIKFIKAVVTDMIPEIVKSKFNQKDIKKMVELSSKEWLNVQESANYMGISDTTFRKWRRNTRYPQEQLRE